MSAANQPCHFSLCDGSIYDAVKRSADRVPDVAALDFNGNVLTYSTLLSRIDTAACALATLGVRNGDRILLLLPNLPQSVMLLYAVSRIGGVSVIMHPDCSAGEIRETVDRFACSVTFLTQRTAKTYQDGIGRLPSGQVVLIGETRIENALSEDEFWRMGRSGMLPVKEPSRPSDASVILFTGGTDGKNKAVRLSDSNLNAAAAMTALASGADDLTGQAILAMMPMFHGFGLGVGIHTALANGATSVLFNGYSGKSLRLAFDRRPIHYLPGVPTMFARMIADPELDGVDLSGLAGVFCGGDALSVHEERRINQFLHQHGSFVSLRQGYGLTEAVSVNLLTSQDRPESGRIGYPLPGVKASVVSVQTGEELPVGELGELCLSGPTVMLGYDDPVLTAKTLMYHEDDRLWLHTGDLAVKDRRGCYRFLQRRKRMLITSGYNVYPAQIEKALESLSFVREACVVGAPDAVKGERICLYLQADPKRREEIIAHLHDHIPRYAMPHRYVFVSALPRTPVGKVDFCQLKRRAAIDTEGDS